MAVDKVITSAALLSCWTLSWPENTPDAVYQSSHFKG